MKTKEKTKVEKKALMLFSLSIIFSIFIFVILTGHTYANEITKPACEANGYGRCQDKCNINLKWVPTSSIKDISCPNNQVCCANSLTVDVLCKAEYPNHFCIDKNKGEDCKPGLCPGPGNIQCCVPKNVYSAAQVKCVEKGGTCLPPNECKKGEKQLPGLCPDFKKNKWYKKFKGDWAEVEPWTEDSREGYYIQCCVEGLTENEIERWKKVILEANSLKEKFRTVADKLQVRIGLIDTKLKEEGISKEDKGELNKIKGEIDTKIKEIKQKMFELDEIIKIGEKELSLQKRESAQSSTGGVIQNIFWIPTATAADINTLEEAESLINKMKEEDLKEINEFVEKKIDKGLARFGITPSDTESEKEPPPEGKFKCWDWKINLTNPSKSYFRAKDEKKNIDFMKTPVTCLYHAALRIYSLIQAFSYVKGSGLSFAEQPLPGAQYCEACNMPFTACTPKRCAILGTACMAIPTAQANNVLCLPGVCEPTAIPVIDKMKVNFFIDRTKLWKSFDGQKVCPVAPPNVSALTNCLNVTEEIPHTVSDIEINIELNQYASCKYIIDKPNASYNEMIDFDENQFYPKNQSVTIDVTGLELGQNHTIYIKCQGTCGQAHDPGFDWNFIKFKFKSKPDELPPVIVKLVPDPLRQYISNQSTEETIEIWLDEAGYCKYSHTGEAETCGNLTTNWSKMCTENQAQWNVKSFKCNRNTEQCCSAGAIGEPTCYNTSNCGRCYMTIDTTKGYTELNWSALEEGAALPEIAARLPKGTLDYMKSLGMTGIGKVFTYMFRCSDKAGNVMKEEDSYMYVIMTYPPFEMNITAPKNNSESYEREWNISVETSRATECRYVLSNKSLRWNDPVLLWEKMKAIDEGFTTEHSGKTGELYLSNSRTSYFLYVKCRDAGGLEEKSFVKFDVLKETTPPKAIRLYKWEDYLYLETDEPSDCVYSVTSCNYNFSDGNAMVGNMQHIHSAPWSLDHLYYVKCKDRWDNQPATKECTTIISPYEVPAL